MLIQISINEDARLFVKKYFRGIRLGGVIVLCLMSASAVVYSAATVPHVFHPGEKISADEVNENFAALKNRLDELESLIDRTEGAPVGAIVPFAGVSGKVPAGWFICDGREVSRFKDGGTEFTDLFNVIGVSWGVGDGCTTYNLPDLRGVFLRGANRVTIGAGDRTDIYRDEDFSDRVWANEMQRNDEGIGSMELDEFKSHSHKIRENEYYASNSGGAHGIRLNGSLIYAEGNPILYSGGAETRPKNAVVHYIIKY